MLLTNSFDELCHALRILFEAYDRAHRGNLLQVDRAEAVGNIETGLSAVLNAFHSLYDAMEKSSTVEKLDWYACGELATVLVIRNARHHNHANKIRTQYTYHAQEAPMPTKMVSYVIVDFPYPDPTADILNIYLSWADMMNLFALPNGTTRLKDTTKLLIREYLKSDKYYTYAQYYEMSEQAVFFSCFPLLVNAAARVVPAIAGEIKPNSVEAKTFLHHFSNVESADVANPSVYCRPFVLSE